MRACVMMLVALMAMEVGAVEILSLVRVVSYSGGLEEPGMINDSRTSSEVGGFSEDLSETLSSPPDAETAAEASQFSIVSTASGALVIQVNRAHVSARAVALAEGTIADAIATSRLTVVFTTDQTTRLTTDIVISSFMGPFFDGPGTGEAATSHIASFLLCVVGGGCLADLFVEDTSDNLQAVAAGVRDSIDVPPGFYEMEFLAVSQALAINDGSALGSAEFSGALTIEPIPEPAVALCGLAALGVIAALYRSRRAERLPMPMLVTVRRIS